MDEDEGKDVVLKCLVDSNPAAEIVWTHENSKKVCYFGACSKKNAYKKKEKYLYKNWVCLFFCNSNDILYCITQKKTHIQ